MTKIICSGFAEKHKLREPIQDRNPMFTLQYPVHFSYPLDEERAFTINLSASISWQPYSGIYIVSDFQSDHPVDITLPELRICKRDGVWVHTDSEAETSLSVIVGSAIDVHEETEGSFMAVLEMYLGKLIEFHGADCGNIQLFDPQTGMIQMLAHRGFQKSFTDYFKYVSAGDGTVCGNAMLNRKISFKQDLMQDPAYIPHRDIIRSAGIHSVISYPLILPDNSFAGVISAHWKRIVDEKKIPDASALVEELCGFLLQNKSDGLL